MTMFILQLAIMCECARTSFISRMLKIRIDERMAIYSALGCEQLRIAICITFHQNIHYKMIERMNELTKNERAFGIQSVRMKRFHGTMTNRYHFKCKMTYELDGILPRNDLKSLQRRCPCSVDVLNAILDPDDVSVASRALTTEKKKTSTKKRTTSHRRVYNNNPTINSYENEGGKNENFTLLFRRRMNNT